MLERFKTIYKPAEAEIIDKKSRFIGHAFPMETEEAAVAQLEAIRKAHSRAGHNCFAWQIGQANQFTRQSDDGEPSGTAGMPILDFLRKEDIKNALIVVTRYFGGTLLGTGGLVRAYGRAAKEAATAAIPIEKILYQKFSVTCPYHLGGKMQYEILQRGHSLLDTLYTDNVEFIVLVENPFTGTFAAQMRDISAAAAEIKPLQHIYCAHIDGKIIQF
ncbi:MAG: YigZ family protein [Defluviitaleaceae bacterium]|nr:YigZ family protein [Defluviitaleaceae bacterium]